MNEAERLLRRVFGFDSGQAGGDVFASARGGGSRPQQHIHDDAQYALFGPSGGKELLRGRDAFLDFINTCAEALADRSDEILAITSVDQQCAFVHARAYRKSAATGEEIRYEWAMLYRVEDGLITYGSDMLDADAQAFWGRIAKAGRQVPD